MNLKNQWLCCATAASKQTDPPPTSQQPAMTSNNNEQGSWCQAIVQANWREVCILTMAFSCIALGIFVVIQGFHWLSQMWVIGPILIMSGLAIIIAAFVIRKEPLDNEILNDKHFSNNRQYDNELEDTEPPEQQAVPMEPLVFLLH